MGNPGGFPVMGKLSPPYGKALKYHNGLTGTFTTIFLTFPFPFPCLMLGICPSSGKKTAKTFGSIVMKSTLPSSFWKSFSGSYGIKGLHADIAQIPTCSAPLARYWMSMYFLWHSMNPSDSSLVEYSWTMANVPFLPILYLPIGRVRSFFPRRNVKAFLNSECTE